MVRIAQGLLRQMRLQIYLSLFILLSGTAQFPFDAIVYSSTIIVDIVAASSFESRECRHSVEFRKKLAKVVKKLKLQ